MTDKEKKNKIADILLEFYEEYNGNMPNRPMIPSIYADKIIDSLQEEPAKDRFAFKAIPRLLDMIEPTDRAKSYVTKLADAFDSEGYYTDAKIVRESLKIMNGEKVAMATMDEEPVSENLKEAADNALESISDQYDIISVGSCLEMFRLGAEWQKQKIVDKACKWIDENAAKYLVDRFVGSTRVVGIDTSIIEDFRKDMEDE